MKPGVFIGAGCGIVLAAAFWFSYTSASHEPVVAAPSEPVRINEPMRVADAPPALLPMPDRPAINADLPPPREPGAPLPTATKPAAAAAEPTAIEAPNPFGEYSRELDYADNLLAKRDVTPEEARSAYDVFARCAEQNPENVRCAESVGRAREIMTVIGRPRSATDRAVPAKFGRGLTNPPPLQQRK